jgi:hypothetical protein
MIAVNVRIIISTEDANTWNNGIPTILFNSELVQFQQLESVATAFYGPQDIAMDTLLPVSAEIEEVRIRSLMSIVHNRKDVRTWIVPQRRTNDHHNDYRKFDQLNEERGGCRYV